MHTGVLGFNLANYFRQFLIYFSLSLLVLSFQNCDKARFSSNLTESSSRNTTGVLDPREDADDNDSKDCDRLGNFIKNGGFEAVDSRRGLSRNIALDALSEGGWDVYDTLPNVSYGDGVSWITESGSSGIEVEFSGTVAASHSGLHYVELDSHPNGKNGSKTNSTMYQRVGLSPGSYVLSFYYRARTTIEGDNKIKVLINGDELLLVDSVDNTQWVKHEILLDDIESGIYKIAFAAAGLENTYGGFLDDVSLKKIKGCYCFGCGKDVFSILSNDSLSPVLGQSESVFDRYLPKDFMVMM